MKITKLLTVAVCFIGMTIVSTGLLHEPKNVTNELNLI
jgi:hypothetical protein